jgi:hypothetical protein
MNNRGVAEAIILCKNDSIVNVLCPYCGIKHKHGVGTPNTTNKPRKEYRSSHCSKGDYFFTLSPQPCNSV